ncbi:MAG: hypothetical protein A1D16_03145 [Flavihumibacter sp. CACIAM 22H1]|nr:MAG: hypothetical protein A1D16_03145 [Flavihumibacter sp. CACIAM 22H1]
MTIYCGLSADELISESSISEYNSFYKNAVDPTSTILNSQFWTASYRVIYRTNAIIEGLSRSSNITSAKKNTFLGEMKTIRAFSYFSLVNIFGEIPLITSTNYAVNDQKPRTSIDSVYKQILTDLTEAVDLLPEYYSSPFRSRINKYTATALLARLYLYRKDWEKAEKSSSNIISSGMYSLPQNLETMFKNTGNETIWQLAPTNESYNTSEAAKFIPSSPGSVPRLLLTETILNIFEQEDLRKTHWIGSNVVNGNIYYFPYKYKNRSRNFIDEYTIVFRLAEQYLIRAEARMQLDNIEGALEDINTIRERAGLPHLSTTSKSELANAIQKERQIEFFAEFGHRWFDLKRTASLDQVLSPIKGTDWQSTDSLYPIPFNEILYNSALLQNAGY